MTDYAATFSAREAARTGVKNLLSSLDATIAQLKALVSSDFGESLKHDAAAACERLELARAEISSAVVSLEI